MSEQRCWLYLPVVGGSLQVFKQTLKGDIFRVVRVEGWMETQGDQRQEN